MERVSEEISGASATVTASLEIEKGDTAKTKRLWFGLKKPQFTKEKTKVALSLLGALAALYVCFSLLFAGLLVASIEVRQEEWLELPSRFFGPFSKVERPVVDLSGEQLTRTLVAAGPDFPAETAQRFFNRPDGCVVTEDGTLQHCDRDNDEDGAWVLFPWVVDNIDRLQSVMTCAADQSFASILADGSVGDGEGSLDASVCINFVPLDQTQQLATM